MGERIPIPSEKLCTAHVASTGEPCKNAHIKGGTVCPAHGGSAMQVRAKANERLLAAADSAVSTLLEFAGDPSTPSDDPKAATLRLKAATEILDRTGIAAALNVKVENDGDEQKILGYLEGWAARKRAEEEADVQAND